MLQLQLEAALVDLLVQQLAFLLTRLPPYVDPEQLLADPDAHSEQFRDPSLARALGWIEGLADAVDLTVLELLDEAGVAVDALRPALPSLAPPRGRDRGEVRSIGPTSGCPSCGMPRRRDASRGPRGTRCIVCGTSP